MNISPLLKQMLSHAATESMRFNIDGVYIDAKASSEKVKLVATDGRRLAVLEYDDPETIDARIIVPRDVIAALKVCKTKKIGYLPFALAREEDGKWSLSCKGIKTCFEVDDDAKFPPYQDVVPDYKKLKESCAFYALNPQFMADAGRLCAFADKYHGAGTPIKVAHSDIKKPIRVDWSSGGYELTVVIMPVNPEALAQAD